MKIWWCSWAIAHHPYVILLSVFIFSSTCLVLPFITKNFPDFSTPQLGFEARGTELAGRMTSWNNLMLATGAKGDLTDNPIEYYNYLVESTIQNTTESFNSTKKIPGIIRKKPKNKNKKKFNKTTSITTTTSTTTTVIATINDINDEDDDDDDERDEKNNNIENSDQWEELRKLNNKNTIVNINEHDTNHIDDNYFCNSPNSNYARVVIGTDNDSKNLWSLEGVLAQCHIDAMLRKNNYFSLNCETKLIDNIDSGKCCKSWSPANYVALLTNRTSCLGVTDIDLLKIEELLKRCSYYYRNKHLTSDCADDINCRKQVPPECYIHNGPYHLLHYLLDSNFISHNTQINKSNSTLKYAMIILPMAASSKTLDFYNNINNDDLSYNNIKVLAMEFGLKSILFDRLLIKDSYLLIFGFLFVTICIWIYTNSIILTISTIIAIIFSLGISYFFYTIIFDIKFFPFMNLLAVVVAVGIGSDDAFIFCKVWEIQYKKYKLNNNNKINLINIVQNTLKHAVPSMLVTSLTTTVAFFASIVSNVTAINCFSLFSGITVIANFFLMITWLPASIVISEKLKFNILSPANIIVRNIIKPIKIYINKLSILFGNYLSIIVIKFKWLWLLLLSITTIIFGIIVFNYPGLRLPDTQNFQYFYNNHIFEKYDLIYGDKFYFEKIELNNGGPLLPLRFVWGIKPIDNGYFLDPSSRGNIIYDDTFDITNKKSQMWLQQFCQNLRTQPFYHDTIGLLIPNCFIESFRTWMKRKCENIIDKNKTYAPCCDISSYPYSSSIFRKCIAEASYDLYNTPTHLWKHNSINGGIKYSKNSIIPKIINDINNNITNITMPLPKIMAIIVEYDSNYSLTLSYNEMNQFYNQVENWMIKQLRTAPIGMKNGWFVSRFEFYELQKTLYQGTIYAFIMSMILAFIVLTLVTLNLLVSFYAILSIGGAILVTVGTLVLIGWRLNVLESVVVSTAIGLAVDFSLHYGVAYRVCHSNCKIGRVKLALEQMGGPTLMAAITSGVSGALMLPSNVLPYIQIAIFMILVMAISWLYATFFFCPLLSVIGPSKKFAQFHYPNLKNICHCFNIKWTQNSVVDNHNDDDDDDDDNDDDDDDNNNNINNNNNANENIDDDIDDDNDNYDDGDSSNKINWRGGNIFSESTLNTSINICQMHCTDIDMLGINNRLIESIPPSPNSPLLFIENKQTDKKNNRRK